MTKLLKKGSVFNWTTEQENALRELMNNLINSPVLAFPRFNIPFYLAVDTSAKGIGYVLYQKHPGNDGTSENTRVVRFGSKALNHWQHLRNICTVTMFTVDQRLFTCIHTDNALRK
jgi:hypothetical protein